MGIMLVYDITNAKSFDNIAKWLRNIQEHANEVIKIFLLLVRVKAKHQSFVPQLTLKNSKTVWSTLWQAQSATILNFVYVES